MQRKSRKDKAKARGHGVKSCMGLGTVSYATLMCVLAVSSCEASDANRDDPQERTYVDIFSGTEEACLRLSEQPVMVVGASSSSPLHLVRGAVLFGEGLAIANGGSQEVLIYDSAVRLVAKQGGVGYGPGEYRNLAGVVRNDDGLITWDAHHGRLTQLDAEGKYFGTATERIALPPFHSTTMLGTFGGSVLLRADPMGFRGGGEAEALEIRQDVEFVTVDLSSGEVTSREKFPGQEEWVARRDGIHGGHPVVFGRTISAAVMGVSTVFADTDGLSFLVYGEGGVGRAHIVGEDLTAVRATPEWKTVVRERRRAHVQTFSNSEVRNFSLSLLEDIPTRATLPAFSQMMGAPDGRLWVREYPNPVQEEVGWVALDKEFAPQQCLVVSSGIEVMDMSGGRVVVKRSSALGEELVEVYTVVR